MNGQRGFVMIAVLVALAVVAAIALLLATESAGLADRAGRGAEALQAEYAAQAALEHALWRADQSSCAAYDLPPTEFGTHKYAAAFSPASGSPTTVTATATLASGIARTIRRTSPVYHPAPSQVVLQPDGAHGRDTWFSQSQPTWNYGAHGVLNAADSAAERSLIAFDLESIPPGARVVSATLDLWATRVQSTGKVRVHPVTSAWVEGTCQGSGCLANGATWVSSDGLTPWQSPGGDYDHQDFVAVDVASVDAWHTWDVTDTVARWISGDVANFGWLLRGSGGANAEFASSDGADPARLPRLTITYRCECGVACAAPQGAGRVLFVVGDNPGAADDRRQALFESWGYAADRISDCTILLLGILLCPSVDFADYDVAYVSDSVSDAEMGNWLTNAPIGVVTEEGRQIDDLGFSSSLSWITGDTLTIADNSHYITQPFGIGSLRIYDAAMEGVMTGGSIAPDLQALGQWWASTPSLAVLAAGGRESGGGTAAAARVLLPLGRGVDWRRLNNNGRLIVQRSLEWAIGENAAVAGAVAYWKLDEGSGTIAADSAGGHDGTLNGATWSAGQVDGGLRFDGSNDFVEVPAAAALDLVEEFTLMAWIRPDDLSGYHLALSKAATGTPAPGGSLLNYWLGTNGTGISFGFYTDGIHELTAPAGLQVGRWYHIAATFSDTADEWKIYLDGVEVAGATTAAQPGAVDGPLQLGRSIYGSYWDGMLDDVRIYDRALAATDIAEIAQSAGGGSSNLCSASARRFADSFETVSYAGNSGELSWVGPWAEVNESDGPGGGDEVVAGRGGGGNRAVRVRNHQNGGEGVRRAADLSPYTSATLTFRAWRRSLDGASDYAAVQISSDGGASWTELDRVEGPGNDSDASPLYFTYDVSGAIAANTEIRFLTSPTMGSKDEVWFDDVQICVN